MSSTMNTAKLKAIVIEMWRRGGMDTLIKAVPKGLAPDPSRTSGYCTTFKFTVGRTPSEIEQIVGLAIGSKLVSGADIYTFDPLPRPAEFELRGYSQCPAGLPTDAPSYVPHPGYPPGLGAPQWELAGYSQAGMRKLATVEPGEKFTFMVSRLPSPR
jgi:hypothetical protein